MLFPLTDVPLRPRASWMSAAEDGSRAARRLAPVWVGPRLATQKSDFCWGPEQAFGVAVGPLQTKLGSKVIFGRGVGEVMKRASGARICSQQVPWAVGSLTHSRNPQLSGSPERRGLQISHREGTSPRVNWRDCAVGFTHLTSRTDVFGSVLNGIDRQPCRRAALCASRRGLDRKVEGA